MKTISLLLALILPAALYAQDTLLKKYEGAYGQQDSIKFHILSRGKTLFMDLSHYGKMELAPAGPDQFTMVHVRPKATLEFKGDTVVIHQIGAFTYIRDSTGTEALTGRYHQDIDAYSLFRVTESGGQLFLDGHLMTAIDPTHYRSKDRDGQIFEFVLDKNGQAKQLIVHAVQPQTFVRVHDAQAAQYAVIEHQSNRKNGFTRADSLMGMLTPLRTCYDVLFYHLDVTLAPLTRTLQGKTLMRFKTLTPFDSLQVDLFLNMIIDSIIYEGQPLTYSREYNAVYVHFPQRMDPGQVKEIQIMYHGAPRLPDLANLKGGFFWRQNKDGQPWIESVVQGTGGSIWWPCKDLNSDKPDSMKISITVPKGLTDISNGQFLGATDLPGGLTRFDWYVHYPINTYDVALNIGTYQSFTTDYIRGGDTIPLRFYYMPYEEPQARELAAEVPTMLDVYTKDFGPFPFPKDGYGLVENFWPMEHQTAVSIGYFSGPNGKPVPFKDMVHTLWHESAHEWWGNSVTCADFADIWIHESFAVYAEVLRQQTTDPAGALRYLKDGVPGNREPVIGIYDVNNFHLTDVYTKGVLMLHTIRHCINNDSLFFAILRGIQSTYKYQAIRTEDIVNAFNQATGFNYTPVFDQYLRYTGIPILQLSFHQDAAGLQVRYQWKADVPGFAMPIQTSAGRLNPTTQPQTLTIADGKAQGFTVDTDNFYVQVERTAF